MKATFKTIFFNNIEEAKKFKQLYDESVIWSYNDYWSRKYYGPKSIEKVHVSLRCTNEEINKIAEAVGLRKCKWAGHLCYEFIEIA